MLFSDIKWLGKHIMKLREYGEDASLLQLQDALLDSSVFLTQDEILYYVMLLRANQLKDSIDLSFVCKDCSNINEVALSFEKDIKKHMRLWNTQTTQIGGVSVTLKEPNRENKLEVGEDSAYYNLYELCACIEIDGVEDIKEWVLNLEMQDFIKLEKFYHENRFLFAPQITLQCECGATTEILIDTFPNIEELCGV